GYNHQPLDTMSVTEFCADVKRSLSVLGAQVAAPVEGYRAPSFSITRQTFWALAQLKQLGFLYDSSIYPVRHPNYGIPDFSTKAVRTEGIWEVPMTRVDAFGLKLPISGGGYFRLYPYALTRALIRKALSAGDVVLYFHPWEFDADQPRVSLPP